MNDISRLLFQREHFPVTLRTATTQSGGELLDIRTVNLPPYHPLMSKNGIDLALVVTVLNEALEYTVSDLEEIAKPIPNYSRYLERITRDAKGRIVHGEPVSKGEQVEIANFPFLPGGYLCIRRKYIMPGATTGQINITDDIKAAILVPETIIFPEELMKEYGIRQVQSGRTGFKRFESPYGWLIHNVSGDVQNIFSKNLIIAIDNAVVKKNIQHN